MTLSNAPPKFQIRSATEADASLMAVVEGFEVSSSWSEPLIHQELTQLASRSWLALGNEPFAYLLLREGPEEWEVINLTVVARVRRKGLGRALMEVALGQIREVGGQSVFLEVRSQNLPARFLYESLGFKVCGERKDYYLNPDDDALIMRLDLPSGTGIGAEPE